MAAIDKDIPIPESAKNRRSGGIRVTCDSMEVGDSFMHPYQRGMSDINRALAPKRFHCAKYLGQYRIWRVE